MSAIDRASTVVGYVLIGLTVLVLSQPGSPIRMKVDRWKADRHARQVATERWDEFSSDPRTRGNTASIALVEFTDYLCPFCRAFEDSVSALLAGRDNTGIVVRHIPRVGSRGAREAAIAAICAGEQGSFEALHTYLFTIADSLDAAEWRAVGKLVGVPDLDEFGRCLESDAPRERLSADSALAVAVGVTGTPAFVSKRLGLTRGVVPNSELAPAFTP